MSDHDLTPSESSVLLLEEAENLIWALLDDQLDETDTTKLAKLLKGHDEVRRRYVECVHLHVDLQDHFAAAAAPGDAAKAAAVLPNLMSGGVPGSDAPVVQ